MKTYAVPADDSWAGINAPKAPNPKAGDEGAALTQSLPAIAATGDASADSKWFDDEPYFAIAYDHHIHC